MKNIIKALTHCVDKDCEGGCPYDLFNGCHNKLTDDTITLLTNQKEEIERLQKLLDEKCDIIKDKEAEIERLKQANKTPAEDSDAIKDVTMLVKQLESDIKRLNAECDYKIRLHRELLNENIKYFKK